MPIVFETMRVQAALDCWVTENDAYERHCLTCPTVTSPRLLSEYLALRSFISACFSGTSWCRRSLRDAALLIARAAGVIICGNCKHCQLGKGNQPRQTYRAESARCAEHVLGQHFFGQKNCWPPFLGGKHFLGQKNVCPEL